MAVQPQTAVHIQIYRWGNGADAKNGGGGGGGGFATSIWCRFSRRSNASGNTGGTGGAGQGNGGNGGNNNAVGLNGIAPGGGGGGKGNSGANSGSGGAGRVIITWIDASNLTDFTVGTTTPNICGGSTATITVASTTLPAGSYAVNYSTTNPSNTSSSTMIFSGGAGSFTTIALPNSSASPITSTITMNSISFVGGGCSIPLSGQTTNITVDPSLTVSAGPDQTICSSSPAVPLAGSFTGSATIATWSGGTGTFSPNNTTLNATYNLSAAEIAAGGNITLTLTTDDPPGVCAAVSDQMVITVNVAATANAGADQQICSTTATVSITGTRSGTGVNASTWSTSGTGTFTSTTNLTTTYTPSAADKTAGTVTITLTTNDPNGPCGAASDQMIVTIGQAATVNAGVDQTVCSSAPTVTLAGSFGGSATTATWSGGGTFSPNNTTLNATYTLSAPEIAAGTVTLTLTTNDPAGACLPATDQMVITLIASPTSVSASPATASMCLGSTGVPLTASAIIAPSKITSGSDEFNSTPTYVAAGTNSGASAIFTQRASGYNPNGSTTFTTFDGGSFMLTGSIALITSLVNSTLTSPLINTNGYSSLIFSYRHVYLKGSEANVNVEASTNVGNTIWTPIKTYTASVGSPGNFAVESFTLPVTYLNQSNLKIRFNYAGASCNCNAWWGIDNVALNGTTLPLFSWTANPPATGGLPANAGNFLNSNSSITVNPTANTIYTLRAQHPTTLCTTTALTTPTVTVNQPSVAPTSLHASSTTLCNTGSQSTTLTQTGGSLGTGATWKWYSNASFTNLVGTSSSADASLTLSPTTTTNYFLRAEGTAAPCTGTVAASGSVTVTVSQPSVAATSVQANGAPSATICNDGNQSITLTQAGGSLGTGANWHWYTDLGFTQSVGTSSAANASLTLPTGSPTSTTTYYVIAENTAGPCPGIASDNTVFVTVIVNPTPTISGDLPVCAGSTTQLTGSGIPAISNPWISGTTAVATVDDQGLVTGVSAGTSLVTYTDNNGCTKTVTVTVNALPVVSMNTLAALYCENSNPVPLTGTPAGGVFIGLGGNLGDGGVVNDGFGNYTFNPSIVGANNSFSFQYSYTDGNGCTGSTDFQNGTVNPSPVVTWTNILNNQCFSSTTYTLTGGAPGGAGGVYSGDGVTGTNFDANAAGVGVHTLTYTFTDDNGCSNSTTNTIEVYPTPTVDDPTDLVVCNNASTATVTFTGAVSGTTFNWTNDNTSIGLAESGSGDILSFTATNTGATPQVATITVTPVANGCSGTPQTFTITVNPTPVVDALSNATYCNNAAGAAITFTSPTTGGTVTFNWTSSVDVGFGLSGTGDIPAYTAANATNSPVTATVSVTATLNGCTGTATTFTITVNPTPVVDALSNATYCNNAAGAAITFTSPTTGGTVTFNWTSSVDVGFGLSGTGYTSIHSSQCYQQSGNSNGKCNSYPERLYRNRNNLHRNSEPDTGGGCTQQCNLL